MPIVERSATECFRRFHGHVNQLVVGILGQDAQLALTENSDAEPPRAALSFRRQGAATVPLATRFGTFHLYLGQALLAEREGRTFRLRTVKYWYKLQLDPGVGADKRAVLRWEYVSETPDDGHCRNHLQFPGRSAHATAKLDFEDLHLPTGWVTIEEVLRFLIHDLGVEPIRDDWPDALKESERVFYEEFTSKRNKAPAARQKHPRR